MAKLDIDLFHRARASGLRKRTAKLLAEASAKAQQGGGRFSKSRGHLASLNALVDELEDRAKGGPAKRSGAAKKAAATRKRKARECSAAARKAAKTRARSR